MGAVAAMGFPAIVPAGVFGQTSPSNRINVGAIGVGHISRGHDLPGLWHQSNDQHGNWLECIKTRKAPSAPAGIGHRACSICLTHHIAMKTKRRLYWNPIKEHFKNDDEANCMLSRPQRATYMMDA
jgi:hypothetical protein